MDIELARSNMIEQQIRPWKVLDQAVLDTLATVHREDFVPPSLRTMAFADLELPLRLDGGDTGEVMLAPKVEARLLQAAALRKHESVLEIGSGSGHMAALLATQARHVDTLEIHPDLARFARDNLTRAGIGNVSVRLADGSNSHANLATYDVIVLSGAVGHIPEFLLNRIAPQGRLVAMVGRAPIMQAQCVTRGNHSGWSTEIVFETLAPLLHGFAPLNEFRF